MPQFNHSQSVADLWGKDIDNCLSVGTYRRSEGISSCCSASERRPHRAPRTTWSRSTAPVLWTCSLSLKSRHAADTQQHRLALVFWDITTWFQMCRNPIYRARTGGSPDMRNWPVRHAHLNTLAKTRHVSPNTPRVTSKWFCFPPTRLRLNN